MFKTPIFKNFIFFSCGAMVAFSIFWKVNEIEWDYLSAMLEIAFIAMQVLSIICLTIAYKTKDTKVQILSYGISREKMYAADFLSFNLMTLIMTAILTLIAIVTVFISVSLNIASSNMEFIKFIKNIAWMYILQINMNMAIFGFTYLLDNVAVSFCINFLVLTLIMNNLLMILQGKKLFDLVLKLQQYLPFNVLDRYLNYALVTAEDVKTILTSFLITLVVYMGSGLLKFRKREIY